MGKKKLVAEEIIKEKQQEIEKWKTRFKQYEEMWFRSQEKCGQLQSSLKEKESKCESDHVSIDDLLSEFDRRGFNTDNWDGDAEAPEAIVSGVKNHINELEDKLKEKEKEIQLLEEREVLWSNKKAQLEDEIERLKDLLSRIVGSMALERVERFDLNNEAKALL